LPTRAGVTQVLEHFLAADRSGEPRHLTAAAAARLLEHSWPGNVRELRNVIARARLMAPGAVIDAGDRDATHAAAASISRDDDVPTAVANLEEAMIRDTLADCGGNRAEAARSLNINRNCSTSAVRQ
jgi:DNA-binding NtrC family response regulator